MRISTLRKFDKFMKKCRGKTFTCSSKSTYSIKGDINELSEEDSDGADELLSKVDAAPDVEEIREIEEHLRVTG